MSPEQVEGKSIDTRSYRSGNRDIWAMPIVGGPARQLTQSEAADGDPVCSPRDDQILFASSRSGSSEIWVMRPDGSQHRRVGIVHKNGILMLDSESHFSSQGFPLREAIFKAGRRRLRPNLMTTLATIFGMLPLALGIGSGARLLRPLAIAVIGGVTVSLILSLLVTPVVFFSLRRILLSEAFPRRREGAMKASFQSGVVSWVLSQCRATNLPRKRPGGGRRLRSSFRLPSS